SAASQRSNPADDAASGISDAAKSGGRGGAARTASRQSQGSGGGGGSRVNFPASVRSEAGSGRQQRPGGGGAAAAAEDAPSRPFRMPADNDIFALRDQERRRKKQERERQKGLRVHEKVPKKSSISFRQAALLEAGPDGSERSLVSAEDPTHTMAVTRDRQIESEALSDYIGKKREMFLLSYSLGVKRDEMRKLEEVAAAEEKKLEMAEQYLEEDASMFDEFLKENNKNSAEAIRIADEEAKAKLQKVNEIKRLNAQLTQMKSEITKFEEQLREYLAYKEFLERLMPEEERQRRRARKEAKAAAKAATATSAAPGAADREKTDVSRASKASRAGRVSIKESAGAAGSSSQQKEKTGTSLKALDEDENSRAALERFLAEVESDDEEDLELYFSKPQELLQIFTELEESNLNLIQNCQESEETLEELRQSNQILSRRMDRETKTLNEQIDKLNKSIEREESKARELEIKCKLFSFGKLDAEEQEEMLQSLNGKVEEVYRACFGDNEASISTLQMLTDIENRIEYLFQTLELLPPELVEAAQKSKDKERRLKAREDKKEQERLRQEERVRRALERAKEPPKKYEGRRVMARSNPPAVRKKDDGENERLNREEEEMQYFFT
ncbi:hypothetical protein BOX15_Mlig025904g2, partial [Macrostomum lignano]